jgi:hydrogenase-4 component B
LVLLTVMVVAGLLMGASGALCLVAPKSGGLRDRLFAVLMVLGGGAGAGSALWSLATGIEAAYATAWPLPLGRLALRLDALSAVFLVPVFLVPALGAVFGSAYWREEDNPTTAPRLRVFYGLMPCAMAGVILAHNGIVLLMAWEVMALSAFFAVATEDAKAEVRGAAWVFLAASHAGMLALLGFFGLLFGVTGSFELVEIGASAGGAANWLFILGLVGFGLKAGIMPLHVWLPGAHAAAPSHVSAVLSGVMLKVGVYGIVRTCWMLPAGPLWWSWVLIGLGACSAVVGICFALAQRDYKRLLAYSSVENVGIIVLAVGVAMLGRATGSSALATLGLAGALLHTWNHSLFKSLLFLVSGALLHACGTRRMNALGGLGKRMPLTAAVAAVGCAAICALPPFNGFVGEWLIYRGVIGDLARDRGGADVPLAVAIVAVALTGALALATFVKFFGMLFLGQERSGATAQAHDPRWAMLAPMGLLAVLCVALGLLPGVALAPVERAVAMWSVGAASDAALPEAAGVLTTVSALGATTAGLALALVVWLRWRAVGAGRAGTWDCGYAAPSARMQYGESSFAALLVEIFGGVVRQRRRRRRIGGLFPAASEYESETPDVVLDRAVLPMLGYAARWMLRLRRLQPGHVQLYILYILLGLIALLVFR